MRSQFMISKSFFNFVVTISMEKVTVETGVPCGYKKDFCDIFAKTHESMIAEYLRRQDIKQDVYTNLLNYHIEKQWTITEV
ncbi:MAG: hypothetical protein JWQ09_4310 [Segetibacter sp.]|nr:hypothetical protein [Segetibacter sp.]